MAEKAPEPEPQALVVPDYGTNPDTMAARGPTSMGSEPGNTPRASGGGGGSDLAAKLEVVTVNPDENAIDKATAAESARLQTNLYNATFWLCVVEAIRMLIQAFVLGTQGVYDLVVEVCTCNPPPRFLASLFSKALFSNDSCLLQTTAPACSPSATSARSTATPASS